MTTADDLFALLPVHVQSRDVETGGLLRALLEVVAGELAVLEGDLDDLYQGWFVETAAPWALPYLADLLGIDDLPGENELPGGSGRRAVVAHTVDYRRRKGTPAVIEQVARDVTGWPSRAVEYFALLAASAHLNHVRLDRPAVADLRHAADLGSPRVARGSLDPAMHTAEVRRAARGRGRYGIGNVGVFLFPQQVYAVDRAPALAVGGGWSVHPLGVDTPLFAVPSVEATIEHLAVEPDLPVPLRPRRLLDLLRASRAGLLDADSLPIAVTLEAPGLAVPTRLSPDRVRVCGLEDLARLPDVVGADHTVTPGAILAGWQVMVDTVTGRLTAFRDGVRAPSDPDPSTSTVSVHTRHAYGGTADVGAGTYDRSEVHETVLATDAYVRASAVDVVAQHVVRLDSPALDSGDPAGPSLSTVLATVADEWAGAAAPGGSVPTTGSTTVVSITDSGSWAGDLTVDLPPATRLVLVAATWTARLLANGEVRAPVPGQYAPDGQRPHVRGTLTVTGGAGSSLIIDGLVLEGDLVVPAGDLGSLTVSQATVTGTVRVNAGTVNRNHDLQVRLVRAAVGGVVVAPTVPSVRVEDSVLSVEVGGGSTLGSVLRAPGAHLTVTGSTLRGDVDARTMTATDAVLDGRVTIAHRQTGCTRYSYVGPGSRIPRRFRCVPADDSPATAGALAPVYASDQRGSPSFLALAGTCPVEIRTGAEDGAEMGVHVHLQRPGRLRASARLLAGYVPVGLEIGMVRDG
ncbi:MAG: hypothetical protein ACOH2F_05865 [Cellulomonas sp.]